MYLLDSIAIWELTHTYFFQPDPHGWILSGPFSVGSFFETKRCRLLLVMTLVSAGPFSLHGSWKAGKAGYCTLYREEERAMRGCFGECENSAGSLTFLGAGVNVTG